MSPDAINQKLVDQYTEIARLAGGLAHEIKNPLSTIRLNMELLAEDYRQSEAPRDRRAMRKIDLVQRECQRLQDLLDGFLDFAKVRRLKLEPSDLNVQVAQVLDFFRPRPRKGGSRSSTTSPAIWRPCSSTARAFMGTAESRAQCPAGDARRRAVGHSHLQHGPGRGLGLDRHRLRHGRRTQIHAFDAFYSTRGGSGLGLPTTRKIIEAHGGRISLQSEVGRGTQFTIALPVPRRLPGDGVRTAFLPSASKD